MVYRFLAPHLHNTANAAKKYFTREYGAHNFKYETPIHKDLPLTPTLSANLNDGYILYIEVSEKAYSNTLDEFIIECTNGCFPIKLWVVLPSTKSDNDFAVNLKKAKSRGIGVIELSDTEKVPYSNALSLSLFGVRKNKFEEFPQNKRERIKEAEQTFLNGNPVKGCQSLYEELEAVTRTFANRSKKEGWWRSPLPGETKPKANIAKDSWARVLKELETFLELKSCKKRCPTFKDSLIASARGVTDPRNLTSHRPDNQKNIIQRDQKLRTWFESTSDLLKNWYEATRPLKI